MTLLCTTTVYILYILYTVLYMVYIYMALRKQLAAVAFQKLWSSDTTVCRPKTCGCDVQCVYTHWAHMQHGHMDSSANGMGQV